MDKANFGKLPGHKDAAGHVSNPSKGLKTIGGNNAAGKAAALGAAKKAGLKIGMGKAPKAYGKGC